MEQWAWAFRHFIQFSMLAKPRPSFLSQYPESVVPALQLQRGLLLLLLLLMLLSNVCGSCRLTRELPKVASCLVQLQSGRWIHVSFPSLTHTRTDFFVAAQLHDRETKPRQRRDTNALSFPIQSYI